MRRNKIQYLSLFSFSPGDKVTFEVILRNPEMAHNMSKYYNTIYEIIKDLVENGEKSVCENGQG